MASIKTYLPGVLLCAAIGAAGIGLGKLVPGIGGVTAALILGAVTGNIIHGRGPFAKGTGFMDKKLLPFTIALLGTEIQARTILSLGLPTIILVLAMIAITLTMSGILGKIFGVSKKCSVLLGCGNAICGSSAIASVTKVINAEEDETGLSIAAVNFMGTIGIFLLPFIVRTVGFNEIKSADVIGGVLQAVGQVVASGYSVSSSVGKVAVLIKMSRVLMLGPIIFLLGILYRGSRPRKESGERGINKLPVPLFIIGFFLMSALSSFSFVPERIIHAVSASAHALLAGAMAAIGMKIEFRSIRKRGMRVLMMESVIMIVQIISACLLAVLVGRM